MSTAPFDRFVTELKTRQISTPSVLKGCTAKQIERLEKRYDIQLPHTYRRYLELMGRKSGRLFSHDWVQVNYDFVLNETEAARRPITEEQIAFKFPRNALIVLGRDFQYLYIRCRGTNDSSVWWVEPGPKTRGPERVFPSVLGWLRKWRDEAAEAVASGWYERHAN